MDEREHLRRQISQYQIWLANRLNRQAQLEQRSAPEWMIERYTKDRDSLLATLVRLKFQLWKIESEGKDGAEND